MMEHYGPFKGIENAWDDDDLARFISHIVGTGIYPNPSTNLQVIANENMTVIVKPGAAWIKGRIYFSDDDIVLQLDNADGVLKRVDRIALRLDYVAMKISIVVKKGTFSSVPVAPVLQRDLEAYELALADISIANGLLEIKQSNILDQRMNNELCGVSIGALQQLDTSTLYQQYLSFWEHWKVEKVSEFESFQTEFIQDSNEFLTAAAATFKNQLELQDDTFENQTNTNQSTFDTQTTTNQDAFDTQKALNQQEFETWFETVQQALEGDIAANLASQIDTLNRKVNGHVENDSLHGIFTLNGVRYKGNLVPLDDFSGLKYIYNEVNE